MPGTGGRHEAVGPRAAAVYALTLAAAVGLFLVIRALGESPGGVAASPPAPAAAGKPAVFPQLLLALLVIVVAGRILGRLCAAVGQPPVIGETLAGILLGPTLLGRVAPRVYDAVLPAEVHPFLGVVAQLGVVLYLFLVGLGLDPGALRGRGRSAVAISHASIVAPFLLGSALALALYPRYSAPGVSFTVFALFLGVAMAVTAFPVLARILAERGLTRTPLGTVALACAASDDVTAWCLLALVVGVAQANLAAAAMVLVGSAAYLAFMLLVGRPLLLRFASPGNGGGITQGTVAAVFAALLASAWVTEWVGIHALFGAFLLGAVIPHDSPLAERLTLKLRDVVTVLLLPAFFAFTGVRTEIGLVSGAGDWLACAAIVAAATLGKFGGTLGAACLTGSGWREGAALGILMNTRGLMELVVLNVGRDLGVLSPKLFAMMVVMALVTTFLTTPVLALLVPQAGRPAADAAGPGRDGEVRLPLGRPAASRGETRA